MRGDHMLVWDAGTGKSVGAIALSLLCMQDDKIDHVLLICERNKLREWVEDFKVDTDLDVRKHHGPNRHKHLGKFGLPQVLVTTYETAKLDSVVKDGPRKLAPGPLLSLLDGKRVLVVYDESAKLRNRSSGIYKAQEHVLRTLRKKAEVRVLALSATPIEKAYEDGFNQLRLLVPEAMPTVKEFEGRCVRYRDMYGRPTYDQMGILWFIELLRPHLTRKRKTDADVIEQFPPLTENYRYVEQSAAERSFYKMIEDLAFERDEPGDMGAWILLRQIAGHPASIIHSAKREDGSALAKEIVRTLGEEHLRSLPCAKLDELKVYLDTIIKDQGAKAVVFTFFGRSVLVELEHALRAADFPVFTYHGGQSAAENEAAKTSFKSHQGGAILLSSDGGARGINIPEATYVIEYESALTHATRIQRINRAHRINSADGPVTAMTFITAGTIEDDIFSAVLTRNEHHDRFVGDVGQELEEEFISAADRRMILQLAKSRYEGRKGRSR